MIAFCSFSLVLAPYHQQFNDKEKKGERNGSAIRRLWEEESVRANTEQTLPRKHRTRENYSPTILLSSIYIKDGFRLLYSYLISSFVSYSRD